MTHYKFIHDEDEVKKFARIILPGLEKQHDYCLMIVAIARRKYWPEDGSICPYSSIKLPRVLVTSANPDRFLRLIKRYEVPIDTFVVDNHNEDDNNEDMKDNKDIKDNKDVKEPSDTKCGEQNIPNEAIALYITINIKSSYIALANTLKIVDECNYKKLIGDVGESNNNLTKKIDSLFKKQIHLSTVGKEKRFIDLDVDLDHNDIPKLRMLFDFFENLKVTVDNNTDCKDNKDNKKRNNKRDKKENKENKEHEITNLWDTIAFSVLTRGGYHIVLHRDRIIKTENDLLHSFHKLTKENSDIKSEKGGKTLAWFNIDYDSQIPIPGTIQGGFKTRLVDLRAELLSILSIADSSTSSTFKSSISASSPLT